MKKALLLLFLITSSALAHAQVYAQLKLWDSHLRYPKINEIEFEGADSALATYDAIYGHGAMWESEYVGFRVYMDHRQSIDLYGKKLPQMELDSTNFYSNAQWMARGYGEDILFAGQSVAAGSFRGWEDGRPTYIEKVGARGQRIVLPGPDMVVVEVWDRDWQYQGRTLQMTQRYTMLRGHRDVQIDIFLQGVTDDDVFCTGVQKLEMDNEGMMDERRGLVGSWGRNIPDKAHPELIEGLGIGVTVPREYLVRIQEDELNYLCLIHPVSGHIRYHLAVAADMQQDGGYHDSASWFDWLRRWTRSVK